MILCDKCKKEKAYEYRFNLEDIHANVIVLTKIVHYCEKCVTLILIELGVRNTTPIESIGPWNPRLQTYFIAENIKYVEELVFLTREEILCGRHIGITMLREVINNLEKVNLTLKDMK